MGWTGRMLYPLVENPETFIAGCNYRLAHIVACKGGSGYCSASGFDLRRTVGRLVLLFKNSTRGKDILVEYLEFVRSELENFHDLYRLDSFQ